ncbi:MAG: ACT domain-containing protein [Bilophila sp.]
MSKIVVSVIGLDCPGVVYAVSSTLSTLECNIEEVSQTILKNQFAAIFVSTKPDSLDNEIIHDAIAKAIENRGMHFWSPSAISRKACATWRASPLW